MTATLRARTLRIRINQERRSVSPRQSEESRQTETAPACPRCPRAKFHLAVLAGVTSALNLLPDHLLVPLRTRYIPTSFKLFQNIFVAWKVPGSRRGSGTEVGAAAPMGC